MSGSSGNFFTDRFGQNLKKPTKESIIQDLLRIPNIPEIETGTEIPDVLPMSVFDLLGYHFNGSRKRLEEYYASTDEKVRRRIFNRFTVGDYYLLLGDRYRRNAISHKRMSRQEAVEALSSIQSESSSFTDSLRKAVGV